MTDLTKAPKEIMLALINTDNGTTLTDALIDFGVPTAATGETPARNTELTVTAKAGSGYSGSVVVTYNRLHLQNDVLTASGKDATFGLGDATKIADFVEELNTLLNIKLDPTDFEDGDLPVFEGLPNEVKPVQLVAKQDSLCYIGSLTFNVKAEDIPLSSVLTITELDGLTYVPPVVTP